MNRPVSLGHWQAACEMTFPPITTIQPRFLADSGICTPLAGDSGRPSPRRVVESTL